MPTLLQYLGGRDHYSAHNGVREILAVWRHAEPVEYREGMAWYSDARETLREIAAAYGYTLPRAAAVTARLSPQCPWADNLAATREILRAAYEDREPDDTVSVCYPDNVRRADAIARAPDSELSDAIAEHVLPDGRKRPRPKIGPFYDNLCCRGSDAVTVDTWASRVWAGDCASPALRVTPAQIDRIARDYRIAAGRVGVRPYQIQAVTWVAAHRLATGPNGLLPFDVQAKI